MPVTKPEPESKTLYQKLIEVMSEIGRIEKRGWNDYHKYAYVMEADLMEAVRDRLALRNVLLIPSLENCQHDETLTTALMRFTFVDAESGEKHEVQWAGTGDDKGDKGLYKAYTGAEKYFLMKMFLISTGDDPEADTKTDKRAETRSTQVEGVKCPDCGGQMWDNRDSKRNPRAPDYKCKDRGCNGAVWEDSTPKAGGTEEALKKALFEQAEKLMATFPEERRKDALGRLALLSAADMSIKVAELAENMKERASLIVSIESAASPEEIADYLSKNCAGKTLDTITLAELRNADKDLSVPF